jgi:hypothetical protein
MSRRLKEYRSRLRGSLLDWLWSQWTTLGVAGASAVEERGLIDPEALILVSCTLGRWDPRLFDEVLDWLTVNGRFVSGARLKRLLKAHAFQSGRVLAAVSSILRQSERRLDWRFDPAPTSPEESLFLDEDGRPLPDYGRRDPAFAGLGLIRGRLDLRGYSSLFDPSRPPCLWLTLRSFMGNSSRVEILVYLLCNEQGYPSRIARDTGHSQRNVQDTLVDMAASGQLHVVKKGREVWYRLASDMWRRLFFGRKSAPRWLLWPPILRALEICCLGLHDRKMDALSDRAIESELFMLMDRARPWLERAGLSHLVSPRGRGLGPDYFSTF